MTDHLVAAVVSVLIALIGVAALSVLLSQQSRTTEVITAGGGAFSQALCTALSPVGGGILGNITGCQNLSGLPV